MHKHWPGAPNLGDINNFLDLYAPIHVDIICAGPPCQPVSQAGKKRGSLDERFLWNAVLAVVARLRPGWVVLENPPGIRPFLPSIIFRLTQMGYLGCYGSFTAAAVGACHIRERYFVLAADPGSPRYRHIRGELPSEEEPRRFAAYRGDLTASFDWGPYGPAVARWGYTLGRPPPWPWEDNGLSPRFLEWMMGFPDGWAEAATPAAQRRLLGNAVVPPQAAQALQALLPRLEPVLGS
jgi:DNA (cytosine-5)-methyltransferase 1